MIDKTVPKLVPCVAPLNVCKRLPLDRSEPNGLLRRPTTVGKRDMFRAPTFDDTRYLPFWKQAARLGQQPPAGIGAGLPSGHERKTMVHITAAQFPMARRSEIDQVRGGHALPTFDWVNGVEFASAQRWTAFTGWNGSRCSIWANLEIHGAKCTGTIGSDCYWKGESDLIVSLASSMVHLRARALWAAPRARSKQTNEFILAKRSKSESVPMRRVIKRCSY